MLLREGARLVNFADTMICDYLIDPNDHNHSFARAWERLGGGQELEDSVGVIKLYERSWNRIRQMELVEVALEIEFPLLEVLAKVENNGVFVDTDYLSMYALDLKKKISILEKEIHGIAGKEFNINSPKQLQVVLFEELEVDKRLGVKRLKKTKTGISTDESVLTRLKEHPICEKILQYRELSKIMSTYVEALPKFVESGDGRVHTHFNQTVAATGRLSSEKPNLQNIPHRSDVGQAIRKAFKPKEKQWVYLAADYSQIELRLLAELSDSADMIESFKKGLDIHRATAAKIFSVPFDQVNDRIRSQAKAVNFGIIYGMGASRLAQDTGVSVKEAKDFIEKYFEAYPGIKRYREDAITWATKKGFSQTLFGRRRPIIGLNDSNSFIANRAENIAVNSPIQGLAADIIKKAMIDVDQNLEEQKLEARLLMQVHDELVFEVIKRDLEEVKNIVKKGMEEAMKTRVPLQVEIKQGSSWFDL